MIRSELQNAVLRITLDRPDQRNALTPPMIDALTAAISECDSSTRALLLAASGPMFCSGFDLSLCQKSLDGSVLRHLLHSLAVAIRLLNDLDCPVVIACQGGAIAGGCALLTVADCVVSDQAAVFGYPVLRLGLSPAVSLPTLAQTIGSGPARVRALDVDLIRAPRAREIGLIHQVVETPEAILPVANRIAADFASKPPSALQATRKWLREISPLKEEVLVEALEASLATAGTREQVAMLDALITARRKT